MRPPACIALLICSLAILCIAGFLPFLNLELNKEKRPRFPLWIVILASLAFLEALIVLARLQMSLPQITDALGLTTAMLAGLSLKWMVETVVQKKFSVHEDVLFRALLVAPVAIALLPGVFGVRPTPTVLFLWFLNGFFWHTLFSDLERLMTKEPILIRRREPPTLPYDFRKPKVD
jgi:hypothetical protein